MQTCSEQLNAITTPAWKRLQPPRDHIPGIGTLSSICTEDPGM
jgi:hypothetical protein